MKTRTLEVNGHEVLTDSEGYLVDLGDWSEDFVRAQAACEGLALSDEHWEVIRFLRDFYERHQVQANVREIIKHFRDVWGKERGSNRHLHDDLSARRAAEAGQPPGRPAAHQGRALNGAASLFAVDLRRDLQQGRERRAVGQQVGESVGVEHGVESVDRLVQRTAQATGGLDLAVRGVFGKTFHQHAAGLGFAQQLADADALRRTFRRTPPFLPRAVSI